MAIASIAKDAYELFDRTSISKSSFQIDGGTATMDFIVDRTNLGDIIFGILGAVEKANDGTGMLRRALPVAHPYYDWLYASKITNIEGMQPSGRELGEKYQRDKTINYIYDFVTYTKYKVSVQFEPRPYLLMSDEQLRGNKRDNVKWYYNTNDDFINFTDPMEYLRFVDIECEPNAEFLSSPQGQFIFKTNDGTAPNNLPVSNQNGGGVNLLVVKRKIKFTWFFVPYEIVFSQNVTDGFGKVNQYPFFNFPAGSLLLEGTEVKRYPPPSQLVANDPVGKSSVLSKLCDITFVFNCMMQGEKDISTKIPAATGFKPTYGHNLLPRAGELKYYFVECNFGGLSRPIYESYPMERLFKLE